MGANRQKAKDKQFAKEVKKRTAKKEFQLSNKKTINKEL